jgi:hypothetical protein
MRKSHLRSGEGAGVLAKAVSLRAPRERANTRCNYRELHYHHNFIAHLPSITLLLLSCWLASPGFFTRLTSSHISVAHHEQVSPWSDYSS